MERDREGAAGEERGHRRGAHDHQLRAVSGGQGRPTPGYRLVAMHWVNTSSGGR